ncbi:MAG: hypothetical protein K0S80_4189 [Neobacillus sp.]|nr:hypothetical protein [Neobacillus sp.]
MDFKHQVFSLISQFTGQNNVITINVPLVEFAGELETGLFLSQLIYWSDRGTRSDGFFYKTDEEWHQEIMLSKYSVRKSRKKLEELGLLETMIKKANGNPTVHYKFNKDLFSEMFISFLRNRKNESLKTENGKCGNEKSLTEITTETTTVKDIYIQYAEFVKMKESEFQKLVDEHGEILAKKMVLTLDNYKGANGKKYKSDYRAILNWVKDKVINESGGKAYGVSKAIHRQPFANEYDGLSI